MLFLLSSFFLVQPASAHGDEPRIEISAESLNPGALLEIRGVDFEFEEEITLSLVGPQSETALGLVSADVEGVFQLGFMLPTDLIEGSYFIRAVTDDHVIESPLISIWGSPQLGGGEEGAWEEGDGLLAPMPTAAPAVSTPAAQVVALEAAPEQNSTPSFIWVLVVVGVLLLATLFRFVKI